MGFGIGAGAQGAHGIVPVSSGAIFGVTYGVSYGIWSQLQDLGSAMEFESVMGVTRGILDWVIWGSVFVFGIIWGGLG